MILFLAVAFVALFVFAYCAIDGRNVTIRHLRGDLASRNKQLSDAERSVAVARIEKDKLAQQSSCERKSLQGKLAEKDARVEKIVGELSEVQWTRDLRNREQYCVTIMVNPRLFGGYGSRMEREDLQYIARHIGDQVAYELASYKYIQKANEYERRYRDPRPFIPTRNPGPITPDTQF